MNRCTHTCYSRENESEHRKNVSGVRGVKALGGGFPGQRHTWGGYLRKQGSARRDRDDALGPAGRGGGGGGSGGVLEAGALPYTASMGELRNLPVAVT